jgi:hypothetical protein
MFIGTIYSPPNLEASQSTVKGKHSLDDYDGNKVKSFITIVVDK